MGFSSYRGGFKVGAGFKPDGDSGFPLIESCDIQVGEDGQRLDDWIENHSVGAGVNLDAEISEQSEIITLLRTAINNAPGYQAKTDASLETDSKNIVGAINELDRKLRRDTSMYQRKSDQNLETKSVTIVGAINEINAKVDNINATGGGADNSIVGTWVFNNYVYADKTVRFQVDFECEGTQYNELDVNVDTHNAVKMYYCDRDGGTDVYDEGWYIPEYKTIKILSDPNNDDFAAWLKANATKQGGSSDNADESYTGTWVFNDTINSLPEGIYNLKFASSGTDYVGLRIGRLGPPVPILIYSINGDDEGYYVYCYANDYGVEEGWQSASYKTIRIQEEPEQTIKDWLIANATKIPDNVPTLGFSVSTDFPTTVWYVLNYILMNGANLSEFNIINLTGYINATISARYHPYGNGSFGLLEASNLLTLKRISDVADWSTVRMADFLDKFSVNTCFEMPQIRLTSVSGNANDSTTYRVDRDNPLKFTVEIVGGGALQVGDALQLCVKSRFNGSPANNGKRKYKLKRFVEYVVTEDDLNSRYLTVTTLNSYNRYLFRDGNCCDLSPLYLRIRRPKGAMQDNDSGQTVDAEFSNIVTVWKSYHRGEQLIRIY